MTTVEAACGIVAPPAVVFDAIANIEQLPETNPDIVGIRFLSDQRRGVGTRFVETRRMGKREMETELEITEWDAPLRVRMVSDMHGTVWDTVFHVVAGTGETTLRLVMEARAHKFLPRLMNPLFKGMFRKGLEKHLVAVKAYCER